MSNCFIILLLSAMQADPG